MPNIEPPAIPSFDPAAAGWEPYRDEGFIGLVGPFWTRQSGDDHLYAFKAESKHHNRRGVVQGGMLMTFADRSMGMTCWYANERQPQATVQLDMHFIDAVQIGEFVEAKCAARARWCSGRASSWSAIAWWRPPMACGRRWASGDALGRDKAGSI